MRLRRLVPLSALALTALVLSGCAGAAPEESATAAPSADPTQCAYGVEPGATSDAIEVEGAGNEAVVVVPDGLEFADLERTIVAEGDGEEVHAGDLVAVQYQIFDGATGDTLETSVDNPVSEGGELPLLLDTQSGSIFVAALECVPLGSQTVLTIPSSMLGEGAAPVVVVAQAVEALPTSATGADQDPVDGMPTVVLGEGDRPEIAIPETDAPTEVEIAVLKKGDGATVGAGDTVIVQYEGVKWSDGTVFDSSWERGAPTSFPTAGVVDGFRQALEGQQAGSQVLVVVPPAAGYGAMEGHELQTETLVFVVDILAVQHALS